MLLDLDRDLELFLISLSNGLEADRDLDLDLERDLDLYSFLGDSDFFFSTVFLSLSESLLLLLRLGDLDLDLSLFGDLDLKKKLLHFNDLKNIDYFHASCYIHVYKANFYFSGLQQNILMSVVLIILLSLRIIWNRTSKDMSEILFYKKLNFHRDIQKNYSL